jgi:hypothetical protein
MQNLGKEIRVAQRKDGQAIEHKALGKRKFSIMKCCVTYNKRHATNVVNRREILKYTHILKNYTKFVLFVKC